MRIETVSDFRRAVRNGPYAWPGGYPCYWITADGSALAFKRAARFDCRHVMLEALRDKNDDEWRPIALEINWEDSQLYCAHSGERIESAYAEDNSQGPAPEYRALLDASDTRDI